RERRRLDRCADGAVPAATGGAAGHATGPPFESRMITSAAPVTLPDYLPQDLRQRARVVPLRRHQLLFRHGDPVQAIFFVRAGRVVAERVAPDGMPLVMLSAAPGEFFAESALAVDRYTCSARACTASEIFALPKSNLLDALRADSAFAHAFLHAQLRNARRQCSRYERLRLRRAQDRIVHYLACESGPDGFCRLQGTLAEWADELGLAPESLYRALARLRAMRRIEEREGALRLL
ncbi:MAG: Crp/Fnr family transcriptional regulator, partial [Rubrivivax sp.]|nr:Crp/Fnr family transcriptional regulator [Rubrivivax sp.]